MNIASQLFIAGLLADIIGKIFEALNSLISKLIRALLKVLENLIIQTPYPKDAAGNLQLYGKPSGNWAGLYEIYQTSTDLALFILFLLLVTAGLLKIFDNVVPQYNASNTINKVVKAMILSSFWWPIGVSLLAFSDILATTVTNVSFNYSTDSGYILVDIFDTIKEKAAIGGGEGDGIQGIVFNIALVIPFILQVAVMLGLLTLWLIRYFVIYLLMPVMPLAFALWAFDFPGLKYFNGIGQKMLKGFVSLVFLSFPGAVIITIFGAASKQLLIILNQSLSTTTPASSMALAGGVAATGAVGSIGGMLAAAFVGIIMIIALPIIAAGGPFYLLNQSRGGMSVDMDAVKGGVKSTMSQGAGPGMIGSTGQKLSNAGGSARNFARDALDRGGSGNRRSGSSGNRSPSGESTERASSGEEGPTSKYGRMKQQMSSGFKTAKEIHNESAGATAGRIGRKGKTASKLMKNKGKATGSRVTRGAVKGTSLAHEHGTKDMMNIAKDRAKKKTANALSEKQVQGRDALNKLKQTPDKIDRNVSKNMGRLQRVKRSAIDKKKELGEADKSTDRIARKYVPDRKTKEDIAEERVDMDEKDRTEKRLENYLESIGKLEEYKESDKSMRQILRNTDGKDIKAYQMPNGVAREVGLDPTESQRITEQFTDGEYTVSPKTTDEIIEHSDEFDDFEDIKDAAKRRGMTTENFIRQKRDEIDISVDRKSIDAPDEQRITSREDAYEKYGDRELIEMSKKAGYGTNVDLFIEKEMVENERKRDKKDNSASRGEIIDGMSQIFDNVDETESVKSEKINEEIIEMKHNVDQIEEDIDRANLTEQVVSGGVENTAEKGLDEEFSLPETSPSAFNSLDEVEKSTEVENPGEVKLE